MAEPPSGEAVGGDGSPPGLNVRSSLTRLYSLGFLISRVSVKKDIFQTQPRFASLVLHFLLYQGPFLSEALFL